MLPFEASSFHSQRLIHMCGLFHYDDAKYTIMLSPTNHYQHACLEVRLIGLVIQRKNIRVLLIPFFLVLNGTDYCSAKIQESKFSKRESPSVNSVLDNGSIFIFTGSLTKFEPRKLI